MEVLEHCHSELTVMRKQVRERMKDGEETPLYREFLDIVGVALDELDLLFLEERLGVADEDDINDLVIHVDWAHNTYRRLFHF